MRFKQFILNEAPGMPLGAGPTPGGAPGMMPPGGGMDPMGGALPGGMDPMGGALPGGMDPMGGGAMGGAPGMMPPGGGMDPMGGMGGGGTAPQVPVKMKDADVWSVLEKLLGDHPQVGGNKDQKMVQNKNNVHLKN